MAWIAVYEEVLGGKLRGFRKQIGCSEAEALGILTWMWLWARKNADSSGLLVNVDENDIASELRTKITPSMNAEDVAAALLEHGWLDQKEDGIYVHDWREWQHHWYVYIEKKEKDRKRKESERKKRKEESAPLPQPEAPAEDPPPKKKHKTGTKKEDKPTKIAYSEACMMYPEERQKLVDQYGEAFTQKLIEELTNYKLSNGKTYKDDYRAVLSWVVEKCAKKYPQLNKQNSSGMSQDVMDDYMSVVNRFREDSNG